MDWRVLDLVKRAVAELVLTCEPRTMTAVAQILQAAQVCYEESVPQKPRSHWRDSIAAKIRRKRRRWTPGGCTRPRADGGADKGRCVAVAKARARNEHDECSGGPCRGPRKRAVFEKKLETSDRRTLSGAKTTSSSSTGPATTATWRTRPLPSTASRSTRSGSSGPRCGSRPECTGDYDEYLLDHAAECAPTPFPSEEEFVRIVQQLPPWKAAGPDGVYNFFITQMTPLHKPLYSVVRSIASTGRPRSPGSTRASRT